MSAKGVLYTYSEINGQPALWNKVYELLEERQKEVESFLKPILDLPNLRIILTGAGSSAFIGEASQGIVQKNTGCLTQAIATTDIVTHPDYFFRKEQPTLLVSFARSGNSPESVEAVKLADLHVDSIYHLVITCNHQGELAGFCEQRKGTSYCIVLLRRRIDKSLAMTGSFTSMLLTSLLVSDISNLKKYQEIVLATATAASEILLRQDLFENIANLPYERAVFLGSGPMLGIARECHLKVQELTDGQLVCKHDSFLGFRHGPRAVVNEQTLVVYLFSQDAHVYKYESDLAKSIAADVRNISTISLGESSSENFGNKFTLNYTEAIPVDFEILPATLIGQLLGYYKALQLGINPDNPSASGAISRVVQGVVIYDKSETIVS